MAQSHHVTSELSADFSKRKTSYSCFVTSGASSQRQLRRADHRRNTRPISWWAANWWEPPEGVLLFKWPTSQFTVAEDISFYLFSQAAGGEKESCAFHGSHPQQIYLLCWWHNRNISDSSTKYVLILFLDIMCQISDILYLIVDEKNTINYNSGSSFFSCRRGLNDNHCGRVLTAAPLSN